MKKFIILAVLICIGGSGLFAQNNFWGYDSNGASIAMDISCIVIGGGLAAVPLFSIGMSEPPYNYILYGFGGGIALFGVIGLIYDLAISDSNHYAMRKNPMLEHVAFSTTGNQTYIGLRFNF